MVQIDLILFTLEMDIYALIGLGVMTLIFIVLLTIFGYYYKLYRLVQYSETWKYWKYQIIGFILVGGGLLVSFYFYVIFILSSPTLALRVPADPFHLFVIYLGAIIGFICLLIAFSGMREFYKKAEEMAKEKG